MHAYDGCMPDPAADQLEHAVRQALTAVLDPEIRRPVTDLGMIRSVAVAPGAVVTVGVDLTVAGDPALVERLRRVAAEGTQ